MEKQAFYQRLSKNCAQKKYPNVHPKSIDDPGAQIETVTPDSQNESSQNDQRSPYGNESITKFIFVGI